jgi:spore cortex formation protein SpoVR/YcgB (stage V sporulation)
MTKKKKVTELFTSPDWTFEMLERVMEILPKYSKELKLELYPSQVEIITSEQMIDCYTTTGLPIFYKHWSFGKKFVREMESYSKGKSGLAYEIIINSDPAIAYLMEDNSACIQTLVLAHAACVDKNTEFLSPTGWKKISEYDNDLVAQYNEDGSATFVKPSRYIKRQQDYFIHVKSNSIDQAITEDHTVVFKNGNGNLVKISGEELQKRHNSKTRGFNGSFITGFNLVPSTSLEYSNDELRLQIAIKADGSFFKRTNSDHFNCVDYNRIRFHLKKQRKIDRLEMLLNNLSIEYTKTPTYDGRYSIVFNYENNIEKRYTKHWYKASQEQLEIISDEVLLWDGCLKDNKFSSEFKEDIEYIQYVWASTNKHTHTSIGSRCFEVRFSNKPYKSLSRNGSGSRLGKESMEYIKSEDGFSYCFTVDSGMFIIRRNDRISVTGNCGHNCFSEDTEILTKDGWKFKDEVNEGDIIASFNKETRKIEYNPVNKKFEYDYEGDMCYFKNSTSNHFVTPNHNMIYLDHKDKIQECQASEWVKTCTSAVVSGEGYLEENNNYSDDELKLLVWCITDGHLEYKPTNYWRWHLKKDRKIERLTELLNRLNLSYKISNLSKQGTRKISLNLNDKFYKILSKDFSLSSRQFNIFITEWLHTNGSFQSKYRIETSGRLFTNVKSHVDKIQELAVLCGAKASYRIDKNNVFIVDIRLNKKYIKLSKSPLTEYQKYKGKVWCVDVDNHTIISRRQGRVLITGNSFFKMNYLFKQWTDAGSIIDYLIYARDYIAKCEENYGLEVVELLLDRAHSIMYHGIDKYKRPAKSSRKKVEKEKIREEYKSSHIDPLLDTLSPEQKSLSNKSLNDSLPEENLIYFIEKNSPSLAPWKKEILRIVRKIAQYLYPQMMSQTINEGWACFVHYYMMTRLWEDGYLTDGGYLEFLDSHTGVIKQYDSKHFNPYYLGFNIFMDIKRICQEPTEEDKEWFPDIAGSNWVDTCVNVAKNYRDESFIRQFLSPNLIRKMKMFSIFDDRTDNEYLISAHSSEDNYKKIRNNLADTYLISYRIPEIAVTGCNLKSSRKLTLTYYPTRGRDLDEESAKAVVRNIGRLWNYDVELINSENKKTIAEYRSLISGGE